MVTNRSMDCGRTNDLAQTEHTVKLRLVYVGWKAKEGREGVGRGGTLMVRAVDKTGNS